MKILILGKTKSHHLKELESKYLKRISFPISVTEVKESKVKDLCKSKYLIILDERGKQFSSIAFSDFLQKRLVNDPIFLVGGPYGIPKDIKNMAKELISLSLMTFPSAISRLVLIEQIYRADTILRNHPYHHE